MELQAVIEALRMIRHGSLVEVVTDSQYVKNGMTSWLRKWKAKGWRCSGGKPVKNEDLWQQLEFLAGRHRVSWLWVKGHSGDPGNERADALARRAAEVARTKNKKRDALYVIEPIDAWECRLRHSPA